MIIEKDNSSAWFNKFADAVNGVESSLESGINSILEIIYVDNSISLAEKVAAINTRITAPATIMASLLGVRASVNSITTTPIGEFVAGDGTYLSSDENGKLVIVPGTTPE